MTLRPGRHPLVDPEHAGQLGQLPGLPGEILHHGGDELRRDIADRFGPGLHSSLVDAPAIHAGPPHGATTPAPEGPPSR